MIMHDGDLRDDYERLGVKLRHAVDALDDPEAKASGSDAAALARARRMIGAEASDDYAADLEADYLLLGDALALASGSGAASVATERRMIRKGLASLRAPSERTKVAELESYRRTRSKIAGSTPRRRKSG